MQSNKRKPRGGACSAVQGALIHAEQTPWGHVWKWGYIRDQAGVAWKILREKSGWIEIKSQDGRTAGPPDRRTVRPPDAQPVVALTLTMDEAMTMLFETFPGAKVLEDYTKDGTE